MVKGHHVMKTLLCCIGRKENRYIREFVEYYKKIGFDHICLYDNNYEGEEHFEDAIGDYVDGGFVEIIDYRGRQMCQIRAYNDCYERFGDAYDWIAFFDCDEFLTFSDGAGETIDEVLSWSGYDGYDSVFVNWLVYGDGGMLTDDGRPVLERFTERLTFNPDREKNEMCRNDVIKIIVRGGLPEAKFASTHSLLTKLNCCNDIGEKVSYKCGMHEYNYDRMYIRHYQCKTIEEFLWKGSRGYADQPNRTDDYFVRIRGMFFTHNKVTREKLQYIKDKIGLDLFKYYPDAP